MLHASRAIIRYTSRNLTLRRRRSDNNVCNTIQRNYGAASFNSARTVNRACFFRGIMPTLSGRGAARGKKSRQS